MLRKYRTHSLASVIVIAVALLSLGLHGHWFDRAATTVVKDQPGLYSIDHFVDGDTIAVKMNGNVEKVRFIGVDTPETHKPNTPVQCYGPTAAAFTKSEIGSGRVRLVSDSLSTNRDRYGRLVRYIYLPDGTNLDELLIQKGYGFYYPYFPFSKADQFAADEKQAQAKRAGLWGSCKPTATDDGGYLSNAIGA